MRFGAGGSLGRGAGHLASVAVWLATGALALWTGSYLFDCWQTLAAPGVPLELRFASPGGELLLRAESFAVDLRSRSLVLRRAQLRDPDGAPRAAAERLELVWEGRTVRSAVDELRGTVRRLPDGSFDFERLLPRGRRTEEPSLGFSIAFRDAALRYEDLSREPALVETLVAPELVIEGNDRDFVLVGEIGVQGAGRARVRWTRSDGQGQWAHLRTARLEMRRLLAHVPRWLPEPPEGPLESRRAVASGEISLALLPNQAPSFRGDLSVEVAGFRYAKWARDLEGAVALTFHHSRIRFRGTARDGPERVDADGWIELSTPWVAHGRARLEAGRGRLGRELRTLLPRELDLRDLSASGTFLIRPDDFWVEADARSPRLAWAGEDFREVRGKVTFSPEGVALTRVSGRWRDLGLSGSLVVRPREPRLAGELVLPPSEATAWLREAGLERGRAFVAARAIVGGSPREPRVIVVAGGRAEHLPVGDRELTVRAWRAVGELRRGRVRLDRLEADTDVGRFGASGELSLEDRRLVGQWVAADLELRDWYAQGSGFGYGGGRIEGTLDEPRLTGRIEALRLSAHDRAVAFVGADLVLDRGGLEFPLLEAVARQGSARGRARVSFDGGRIEAILEGSGFELDSWIDPSVFGRVDAFSARVSGTLDNPVALLSAQLSDVGYEEVRADRIRLAARYEQEVVELTEAFFEAEEDRLEIAGSYDLRHERGRLDVRSADLSARQLQPWLADLPLEGRLRLTEAQARFESGELTTGRLEARVEDLALDAQVLGSGSFSATFDGRRWVGRASLGSLERFLDVERFSFEPESGSAQASVVAFDISLSKVRQVASALLPDADAEALARFEPLEGEIVGRLDVGGSLDELTLDLSNFELRNLFWNGRPAGRITAEGARRGERWELARLQWLIDDMALQASGTLSESGELSFEGDWSNFDLSWLSTVDESLPKVAGRIDVPFRIHGTRASPVVQAAPIVEQLAIVDREGRVRELPLVVLLSLVELRDRVVSLEGSLRYADFVVDGEARIPVDALAEEPGDQSLEARLRLRPRDLADFSETWPALDRDRTRAILEGEIVVSGRRDDLALRGELRSSEARLAFRGIETSFEDLELRARGDERQIDLSLTASGSDGGDAELALRAALPPNWEEMVSDLEELLASVRIDGSLRIGEFTVLQGRERRDRTQRGTVEAELSVRGALSAPAIEGRVAISGVDVEIPTEWPEAGEAAPPLLNPAFSVRLVAREPASVRLGSTVLALQGEGSLTGTLQYPELVAKARVESGLFRLPTNRVFLEPGGTVALAYRALPGTEPTLRLDLDLVGRTNVTARRFDSVERYDVLLTLRGNALEDGALSIDAQSFPPDLGRDEILALLGERRLLESLGREVITRPTSRTLLTTALDYALSSFADSLVGGFAEDLGLDWIAIEYNALEGPTVAAAKTLGRGLTLSLRRQIAPLDAAGLRYSARLTYRLPSPNPLFNRARIGIGLDQDRPWRLSLEYWIRF